MKQIGLTQRVEHPQDHTKRRDCMDESWSRLLAASGFAAVALPNRGPSPARLIKEFGLDGIILTGGNDLVGLEDAKNTALERDKFEEEILKYSQAHNFPILGVCRGFQVIIRFYNGQLAKIENHVAKEHPIIVCDDSIMPLHSRDRVNSYHNYGISQEYFPPDLIKIATAPDGTVEAAAHRSSSQWGIMWHPERVPENPEDVEIIKRLFNHY